jgi:hypothetical protein
MTDPFAYFMDVYAPSCGVEEAFRSWLIKNEQHEAPYVMPDIEPFKDTSGKEITGRAAWREHLRATGTQEMGHADLKAATERHAAARREHWDRLNRAAREAPAVAMPERAAPVEPSRAAQRVMERLHGRPMPDRPTLIKIAIEERMRKV